MIYEVIHGISTGPIVDLLSDAFQASDEDYAFGVVVAGHKPDPMARRVVTVRDDGGPDETVFSVRRHGFNVWADNPVDSERIALFAGAVLRRTNNDLIVGVDQISSPVDVTGDTAETFGGKNLSQFYFAARVTLRGQNF